MAKSEANDETGVDYQIGVHDIDKTPALGDEGDFIEFEYESAAIFKRLADDIYESSEAGIREPLSNSITAVRRAEEECSLENGVIEITLYRGDDLQLVIQDNGLGISREVLEEVLAVIGRSTARDDGELSGKYGMGFLACYKLVGTDGGFVMHTNSRKTDGTPISGVWKPGGFDFDSNGALEGRFDDDQYGTRLEFHLTDDIEADDVREWVEEHAEWSRVPVIYREFDEDGGSVFNEDYGIKRLADQCPHSLSLVLDNEHFTAVSTSAADGETLLLDSPIERNDSGSHGAPWRFDVRFKNENGVVVEGPNEGLMPVGENEYRNMDPDRRTHYIPESELTDQDITLPDPIGTRDKLREDDQFWYWLGDQFDDLFQQRVAEALRDVTDLQSYFDLDKEDQRFIATGIKKLGLTGRTWEDFQRQSDSVLGVQPPEPAAKALNLFREDVGHIERPYDAADPFRIEVSDYNETTHVSDIIDMAGEDGDVYMGVSLNVAKCNVVWEDNEQNCVVQVEGTEEYEKFEPLGWKELRNIDKHSISEYDVDEDTQQRLQSTTTTENENAGKDAPDRTLTLHRSSSLSWTTKQEVADLRRALANGEAPYSHLILFPANAEQNLSDYGYLADGNARIANCAVKVWDYLKDLDAVTRIEDYLETARNVHFTTSKGEMTLEEVAEEGDEVVLHALEPEFSDIFHEEQVLDGMVEWLLSEARRVFEGEIDDLTPDDVVYVPASTSNLDKTLPLISEHDFPVIRGDSDYRIEEVELTLNGDLYPYLWARLPNWRGAPEIKVFNEPDRHSTPDQNRLSGGGYEIAQMLVNIHDRGLSPESADFYISPEEVTFETSHGSLTAAEIREEGDALFHVMEDEKVEQFRCSEAEMRRFGEYIEEHASARFRTSENLCEQLSDHRDTVYIPVTKTEYVDVVSGLFETPPLVTGSEVYISADNRHEIEDVTEAYAYGRLGTSYDSLDLDILSEGVPFTDGGYELVETLVKSLPQSN